MVFGGVVDVFGVGGILVGALLHVGLCPINSSKPNGTVDVLLYVGGTRLIITSRRIRG
jgi:hypothetical protein